ncbi:MAG: class I SAM-dependent methyltransferase [Candidatus Hodarchaeota archaeon]
MNEKITFSFGKNWQKFLKNLTKTKLKNAELSLTDFLKSNNLKGKTFLDIGCGSGIFSYAAFNLNAKKIVSFDIDPFSVECCKYLHKRAGAPKNWEVYRGSILDDQFISELGTFDIVYAWGVLHHTGKMWDAIKKSTKLVKSSGYYYIAIYNKVDGKFGSKFWLKIKKISNTHPIIGKYIFETIYILKYFTINLLKMKNPFKQIEIHEQLRGMDWRRDVSDWFRGYPYEFATIEEIVNFVKSNIDSELIHIKHTRGYGNNWYLFRKN